MKKPVQGNFLAEKYSKETCSRERHTPLCTGSETDIGILKMGIFKTAEGIVVDGLSSAENAHLGDIFLVRVGQQGNHSLCGKFSRIW